MQEVIPGLLVGDLNACMERKAEWAVVHACKHPCYHRACGQRPPDDPHYFGLEQDGDLFLNIIDPPKPLFSRTVFDFFLDYATRQWKAGRTLLIHCNQGESRGPTLALLFLAKRLGRISDTDFDCAWDDYEKLAPYEPGDGIEEWMRGHWHALKPDIFGHFDGAIRGQAEALPENDPFHGLNDQEAAELIVGSPLLHFAGFTTIEDKNHQQIQPVPNIYQTRFEAAYQFCLLHGIPPRLMGLKPRQVGSSTFAAEICYHHARRFQVDGMIIGDEASRTEKVWQIFCDYAAHDSFPWSSTFRSNSVNARFTYPDGTVGQWEHDTANDPKAGISGTRQVLYFTESGRYAKSGQRTDVKVITASLNSLAKVPHSLAIAESTADGAAGWHYDNWIEAVTLEEAMEGKFGNGWIKVFAAWFEFIEHNLPRTPHTEEYFKPELTDREKKGIKLYRWTAGQIAWRRAQIKNECAGDERVFDQDFPENDEDCFLSSGRPKFNNEGVTRLELQSKIEHDFAEVGVLERAPDGGVEFRPQKEDSWLWVRQRPKFGCSYIGFIDPCTGEQSKGAKNPDAHAAGIIRDAYLDTETRKYHNAELVAAIDVPGGCRWEATPVARRLVMLLDWYGGCMVVPETGNGLGVLVKLRDEGARIYRREKQDQRIVGQFYEVDGWETNEATRDIWVEALADFLREQTLDCAYKPAVREIRTFVINDRGKAEAKHGCHDDWVTGIGMALACRKFSSVYRPIVRTVSGFGDEPRVAEFGRSAFS